MCTTIIINTYAAGLNNRPFTTIMSLLRVGGKVRINWFCPSVVCPAKKLPDSDLFLAFQTLS